MMTNCTPWPLMTYMWPRMTFVVSHLVYDVTVVNRQPMIVCDCITVHCSMWLVDVVDGWPRLHITQHRCVGNLLLCTEFRFTHRFVKKVWVFTSFYLCMPFQICHVHCAMYIIRDCMVYVMNVYVRMKVYLFGACMPHACVLFVLVS